MQHSKIQYTAVFVREKQTVVHVAFQNRVNGSFFQRKTDCRANSIPKYSARQFFLEKNRLPFIQHSKIQYTAVFVREKQTAVHVAFQNRVNGRFFSEKQTAVHIAFQDTVHGSFCQRKTDCHAYSILKYSTRLPCIQTRRNLKVSNNKLCIPYLWL